MRAAAVSLIAALLLATSAVAARELQGNMPKPVQALPKYPPVICVAPNWTITSCETRRAEVETEKYWKERDAQNEKLWTEWQQLKQEREIEFENKRSGAKTVLYYEPGGILHEHEARWRALAESGDDVEMRGPCVSGCTMIMAYVPKSRLCFAWGASLWFHKAASGTDIKTATPSTSTTLYMLNQYPPDIKAWLLKRGGVEEMTVEKFWVLHASELWEMGYRKCDPESMPVPMTKKTSIDQERINYDVQINPPWQWGAMQHYRKEWK
jgi:hypothetical protein